MESTQKATKGSMQPDSFGFCNRIVFAKFANTMNFLFDQWTVRGVDHEKNQGTKGAGDLLRTILLDPVNVV